MYSKATKSKLQADKAAWLLRPDLYSLDTRMASLQAMLDKLESVVEPILSTADLAEDGKLGRDAAERVVDGAAKLLPFFSTFRAMFASYSEAQERLSAADLKHLQLAVAESLKVLTPEHQARFVAKLKQCVLMRDLPRAERVTPALPAPSTDTDNTTIISE